MDNNWTVVMSVTEKLTANLSHRWKQRKGNECAPSGKLSIGGKRKRWEKQGW